MKIQEIIKKLDLSPHPEGGWYKEIYRSEIDTEGIDRKILTSIYFLLSSDNVSRFHSIKSDEIWYYHAGSSLLVHTLGPNGYNILKVGNDLAGGEQPQVIVSKGLIFGSTVAEENAYSLVSCAVAPGFDFRDFKLYSKAELLALYPQHPDVIERLGC